MKKVYNIFADEYIDESKKSPYAQPERYTKMLGENIARWLLKRLLKKEADREIEPQTIVIVKDHGRKQALEMINLYHELKDEPQTERSEE